MRKTWPILFVATAVLASAACGDDEPVGGGGQGGGVSQGGEGGGNGGRPPTGGAGGTGASGGEGGTTQGGGGAGGGEPESGFTSYDFVGAGDRVQSQNYQMVFTFGQSTQNQGLSTSQSYQMQGGLIGVTGSTP